MELDLKSEVSKFFICLFLFFGLLLFFMKGKRSEQSAQRSCLTVMNSGTPEAILKRKCNLLNRLNYTETRPETTCQLW